MCAVLLSKDGTGGAAVNMTSCSQDRLKTLRPESVDPHDPEGRSFRLKQAV